MCTDIEHVEANDLFFHTHTHSALRPPRRCWTRCSIVIICWRSCRPIAGVMSVSSWCATYWTPPTAMWVIILLA